MSVYLFILTLMLSLGSLQPAEHPIHVSKCQIEHDRETKHFQIILHVFIDDLEESMQQNGGGQLDLGTDKEAGNADEAISTFLKDHFQVYADKTQVELDFIGKELSEDYMAFWCYLESKTPVEANDVEVYYDLLMDLYDDQKNILNLIRLDHSEEYALLHIKKQRVTIDM